VGMEGSDLGSRCRQLSSSQWRRTGLQPGLNRVPLAKGRGGGLPVSRFTVCPLPSLRVADEPERIGGPEVTR
jgi:hypothetical protein